MIYAVTKYADIWCVYDTSNFRIKKFFDTKKQALVFSKSKRVVINFDTINGSDYKIIPQKDIAETNARISEAMKFFKLKLKKRK